MNHQVFHKDFEVHYYEVNMFEEATPVTILHYLEETAVAHSEAVGLGVAKWKAEGVGWVLSRWLLKMDRYPKWGEKVMVETWPSNFERFYATREFVIKNATGEELGRATSLWIYLNIEKKRPIRIPVEFNEKYGVHPTRVAAEPFAELDFKDDPRYKKEFSVRKSDIDTNEHVNNARYVEWMLEAVPDEVYDQFTLFRLEVIYKKETGYGTLISSGCIELGRKDDMVELNHIIKGCDNGQQLALARSVWRKR